MAEAKPALVYDNNAVQKLLAEKHGVPLKNVIKSQYSFTVILGDEDEQEANEPRCPNIEA